MRQKAARQRRVILEDTFNTMTPSIDTINMTQYFSAYEKLQNSVITLASGTKNLKERIIAADEFQLHYLTPEHMPPHLQDELKRIQNAITKNHTKAVREAIYYCKKSKTKSISEDIVFLFSSMSHFYHSGGKT